MISAFKPRRTSRIALRIPVILSHADSTAPRVVDGWTVVINENGARLECLQSIEQGEEFELKVLSTGRTARGRVVWANSSQEQGRVEMGVELYDATHIWGVGFPPDEADAEQFVQKQSATSSQQPKDTRAERETVRATGQARPLEISHPESGSDVNERRVNNALKELFEALLEGEGRAMTDRLQQVEKRLKMIVDRAESGLQDSAGHLERSCAKAVADTTEHLKANMAEVADVFLARLLTELNAREKQAVERIRQQGIEISELTLLRTKAELARCMQDAADAVDVEVEVEKTDLMSVAG